MLNLKTVKKATGNHSISILNFQIIKKEFVESHHCLKECYLTILWSFYHSNCNSLLIISNVKYSQNDNSIYSMKITDIIKHYEYWVSQFIIFFYSLLFQSFKIEIFDQKKVTDVWPAWWLSVQKVESASRVQIQD